MNQSPSPNGSNGRERGRFAPGNTGGPGNPFARRVGRLRSLILEAVSDDDLRAIVGKLVEQAKAGDLAAAREVFNRLVGKPTEAIDPDRMDLHAMRLIHELADAFSDTRFHAALNPDAMRAAIECAESAGDG